MANRRAGFHGEFFSRIIFLFPRLYVARFKPSFLSFSPCFVILPGGAGVKGWGRGKTFDSVSLSWRNPLTDLCILAHNDKWVCNFPPDWGATKHISTFTGRQREYSLPLSHLLFNQAVSVTHSWTLYFGAFYPYGQNRQSHSVWCIKANIVKWKPDFTQWGNLLMKTRKACFSCITF